MDATEALPHLCLDGRAASFQVQNQNSSGTKTIRRQDDGGAGPDKMSPFKRINTEFGARGHLSMRGFGKSEQLMKTSRRQDDGGAGPDKMSPFERINTEFGAWKTTTPGTPTSTKTPSVMLSSSDMILYNIDNPKGAAAAPTPPASTPSPASATGTSTRLSCRTVKPHSASYGHGTPRYSKIDTFIEHLDAACEALPIPLVGSASDASPPASRATPTREVFCSHTKQEDRHPRQHARKTQQHQEDHCPLVSTGGIVKEVKFADKVIEIGHSQGMVLERTSEAMSTSERKFFEVRCREPSGGKAMPSLMADRGGAPPPRVSRALRFDYRKKRSEFVKAATVVQSTYRGYNVRKGQPLKYLVAISSVKEKLEELRQQFDAWKIAAWFPTDLTERVTMTESVMDLLLQLDSLQGVPVVVREFRKTVARDVIKFQEEVDGFLCRNSKHGVLFDLTRPGAKSAQGSSNLNPSKTIRNILVQEPNYIENLPESDYKACSTRHSGNWKDEAKVGTMTSVDVTSGLESDSQSKISEVPSYSVQPHGSRGRNFVLWCPGDAKFEKVRVEDKNSEENKLYNVTELKKCVSSTGNLNICVSQDKKKKSLRVRFANVSFGNRSARKEHLSTDDESPNAPPENTSPCNSTCVELLKKDLHHSPDILSWEPTENCQKTDDSQCTVSIHKQRSLDPYANSRIQLPIDDRIREVHENLVEECEIRYPQTHARPQTPAQSDYSLTAKWDSEFPPDLHLDNSIEVHKSYLGRENGQDLETRHPQLLQPDYSLREKWEEEFPADLRYNKRIAFNKNCTGMENTPAVMFEPTRAKDEDLHIPAEEGIRNDLYNEHLRPSQTNLQAFPSRVEYVSAKDVREGTIEPLLASDQGDREMDYPSAASQLDRSSNRTFRTFGGYEDIASSPRSSEGNRMGTSQDMPNGLDAKEGDPCTVVDLTEDGEKLDKLEFPGLEAVDVGNSSEHSPVLVTPTSILNGNIRQQLDRPGNEHDPCGFDDLETISSCSNCPAYPADCVGEPRERESDIHEQVQHQPYALKGLVRELDEVLKRKEGDKLCFEAGQWKDEAWRHYTSTEFRPHQISQPNFEREAEAVRDDGSCKSFNTFESGKVQYFRHTEPKFVVGTKLVSPYQEDNPDIKELTCPESKGPKDCTSQSLGDTASGSTTLIPTLKNESNMLSKLVEDNKRLKELLKEVMKWNTVQANAIITLNDRLELVESKK